MYLVEPPREFSIVASVVEQASMLAMLLRGPLVLSGCYFSKVFDTDCNDAVMGSHVPEARGRWCSI